MSKEERLEKCGEMGIAPSLLECLSDEEIGHVYTGYMRKMASLGNLMILAIRKAEERTTEPFTLPVASKSREETFEALGLEDDD